MNSSAKALLQLMFRDGESICVSPNKYGYHSVPLTGALDGKFTLLSPNEEVPLSHSDGSDVVLVALNPISGFRQDMNCTAFRNFLVELDCGTTEQQLAYIQKLGLPYSAVIFSGNKSLHFLISLNTDLSSMDEYRRTAEWILSVVTMADQNTKNPSRSIRIPGVKRDNGRTQDLIEFRSGVTLDELSAWLSKYPHLKPGFKVHQEISAVPDPYRLSPWARKQLRDGIDFKKGRNATWFALACDFARAGFCEDATTEYLSSHFSPDRDFSTREWSAAIRSAFRHVHRESFKGRAS